MVCSKGGQGMLPLEINPGIVYRWHSILRYTGGLVFYVGWIPNTAMCWLSEFTAGRIFVIQTSPIPFCCDRLKKKERARSKKKEKQKQPAGSDDDGKQEASSAESGGDSDDAYENPFVIGGS